jgi:hypothetical protein
MLQNTERCNTKKGTIQRNRKHRAHKMKKKQIKNTTQYAFTLERQEKNKIKQIEGRKEQVEKEELINIIKEKEATVEIDDPTSFYISVFDDNLPS